MLDLGDAKKDRMGNVFNVQGRQGLFLSNIGFYKHVTTEP